MTAPFVRPDVAALLEITNRPGAKRAADVGLEGARGMMHASRKLFDAEVGALAVIRDIAGGPCPMRLYDARAERGPGPALVFYHGGGFVIGDLDTHEPLCAEIARLIDLPVVSVDYALAPEAPFPAGVEDAIAAARWIGGSPAELGRSATGLVLAGDSAGGNFTIVTALALRDAPAAVPVLAQWAIYPAGHPTRHYPSLDLFGENYLLSRESMAWFDRCYRPDPKDWRYDPLAIDQAGLPPTLVVTAGLDPIRDQGRAYAAACAAAGVETVYLECPGTIHGFLNLRKALPSAQADLERCIAHLKLLLEHRA
ncbi:alpha/beta hydrolase [Sphingomonas astaxanthinifaciens]|uniref:Acetylhydrolase n=1 Tax=Sphingomonas astaxanthinifaciens DSM 22298 TaxID=1123267 RepID=A0ABQ5Z4P3_9SPHN|nr:alpha/beta hydrolase [Sphingomonas astaxanthinifaciens]GLR46452.1 acetylhydrolase [Sphingomonas astaxanthinifaciens DSM 22298]